jgi:hypothetical protein
MFVIFKDKKIVYLGTDHLEALQIFGANPIECSIHQIDTLEQLQQSWDLIQSKIGVGDSVQWTSQGVDQFVSPRTITRLEGKYAWVEGTATGIPIEQLVVVKRKINYEAIEKLVDDFVVGVEGKLKGIVQFDKIKSGLRKIKRFAELVLTDEQPKK